MPDAEPNRKWLQFSLRTLVLFVAALSVLWGLTASWGVRDVEAYGRDLVGASVEPDSKFLEFDAMRDDRAAEMPWHYVGNASSLMPLIVGVDWTVMKGRLAGTGGRSYFLWFFGLKIHIHNSTYWIS